MAWGMRRRKLTPEEVAANAEAKRLRDALCMTCQICGRQILANTGKIAHHGYERPYEGFQTSSCFGARALPYQADRSVLMQYIDILRTYKDGYVRTIACIVDETKGCLISYKEHHGYNAPTINFTLTRANFEEMKKAHEAIFVRRMYSDYDKPKGQAVEDLKAKLKSLTADIKQQQARYDAWKLTHVYDGAQWTKGS